MHDGLLACYDDVGEIYAHCRGLGVGRVELEPGSGVEDPHQECTCVPWPPLPRRRSVLPRGCGASGAAAAAGGDGQEDTRRREAGFWGLVDVGMAGMGGREVE